MSTPRTDKTGKIDEHVKDGVKPCRTTAFVELPHEAMLVEIDAQAVVAH